MPKPSPPDGARPRDEDAAMARPFYLILYLVMVAGYATLLVSDPSTREPARLALFTALVLVHGGLYRVSERLAAFRRRLLAYFALQVVVVFSIGLLAHGHWLAIALYMALAGQFAGSLWPDVRAIALGVLVLFSLLVLNIGVPWGLEALVQIAPVLGIMFAFVVIYVVLFTRQAQARERAQALLRELETTHRQLQAYAAQVEELTISQERERMARELHDTLAQGLAGLILQLEAADSHLEGGDPARAQAVVQQAMQRARTTLAEARRAIQALRPTTLEQGGLVDALGREIDQFAATTGVRTAFEVGGGAPDVPPEVAQDILRIVQESLSNVARHAHASHVLVRLNESSDGLQIVVQDDGVGFDPEAGLERPGCFGLAGMQERASRLGGVLRVESAPGEGTRVVLSVEGGREGGKGGKEQGGRAAR
jgi:NarL family two-component system sensor histidine kinase YdfH